MSGASTAGLQDAGHVEPHVVGPDPLAGEDPVDPETLGGGRAEHGHGLLGGCGVEVAALGDAWCPRCGSRPRLAASMERALVSTAGMSGLR